MKLPNFYLKKLLTDVIKTVTSRDGLKELWGVRLYSNAFYLMANSVVTGLLGFVFWIVAARFYPPEDVGLASALIAAVGLLAGFTHLGLDVALVRYLARSGKDANSLINTVFTITILTSILGVAIFVAGLGYWSPALVFMWQSSLYLVAFILFVIIFNVSSLQDQIFIAERRAGYIVARNTIFGLLKLLMPILLAAYFHSFGIFASWGVSLVIAFLLGMFLFIPRARPDYKPFFAVSKKVVREIMQFSFVNYFAGFFWGATNLILPIMVLNVLGAESTAYFYIAWSVGGVCMLISSALSVSLFAEGSYDEGKLGLNIRRSLKLVFLTLVPAVILIVALADVLLLLFGGSYSESGATLLRIVAVTALPWSINLIYLAKLRVEKKLRVIIVLTAFTAVLGLGLAYFLLPRMGISGAGVAWLTTQVIIALAVTAGSLGGRRIISLVRTLVFREKWR